MGRENDFSRLELSLDACLDNYRYFRDRLAPATRMLVLVKANAYGHGAVEFASMMQRAGADYLAVALPVEGVELRAGGISLPILVLTSGTDFFEEIISNHLEPGIPNVETLEAFQKLLRKKKISRYPVHIKLDTGMHRLGFMPSEIDRLLETLDDTVEVRSIYSHLAAAEDPAEDEFTLGQIRLYCEGAERICAALPYKPMRHILNSAGIERFPDYQFDMVRLGIGIYGVSALPGVRLNPVASLKAKILQIKTLDPGDGTVGYSRRGKIPAEGMRLATIPLGYADGIDRRLGCGAASFLVGGHPCPTVGNICMDMCMIDVSGTDAEVGDTVTVFGDNPRVEELADILGTIPYEILTSIPRRIERILVK